MTSSQRQNLDYFINKIVTFLTPPISRQLHDKDVLNYEDDDDLYNDKEEKIINYNQKPIPNLFKAYQ